MPARGWGPVKEDEELQTILDAVYDCTTVDLQFQEATSAKPGTPTGGVKPTSTPDPASGLPVPRAAGSSGASGSPTSRVRDEEMRGGVLQGEHVSLLLCLRPQRDKLEECIGHTFGLYGSEQKQLDCWKSLTSVIHAEIQLLPLVHPSVERILSETKKSKSRDVSVLRGKDDFDISPEGDLRTGTNGLCRTTQTARPLQVASLPSNKSGECRSSVYKLEFVVKDCGLNTAQQVRDFIHVRVELGSLASLKRMIAEATEGAMYPHPGRENTDVSLALGNLCCHPTEEDTAVLRDLSNVDIYSGRSCMSAPSLLVLVREATVLGPLKVDVSTTEPYPGFNCVQVTVCNPLSLNVTIADLCVHLPTTIPSGLENVTANDPETLCILSSIPSVANTAITSPCGFEATLKIECYMVAAGKEPLPVLLRQGEAYGFMFIIRPYDMTARPAISNASPRMRGGGDRIDGPLSPDILHSPMMHRGEDMQQSSKLTISFKVDGLSSCFDKHATVKWKFQAKPTQTPQHDDRLSSLPPFVASRMRRKTN
eukprot:TRINITY_DN24909_c0_g1_i1.p1 TRINITY_DN24909_c0_g1~~TRINITY_DN24909_c0_g1_i1.p1  ORF type:complete len:538 (+),score=103.73 TRINITY_DN24909_c0_g1_i1:58-1671(+)